MSPIVLAFSFLGVLGIGLGLAALWKNFKGGPPRISADAWRNARIAVAVVGLGLGGLTVPMTFSMGYPVETADGHGRVVGIPFFVAYIDRLGEEYLSSLSLAGAVGNGVFWFLTPQFALFFWAERRRLPA
jgi:hypothetical protein